MPIFKYFKRRCPPPSLEGVIDLSACSLPYRNVMLDGDNVAGLGVTSQIRVCEVQQVPGLYFIPDPFTSHQMWTTKCLREYAVSPNPINIIPGFNKETSIWTDACQNISRQLSTKLIVQRKQRNTLLKSLPIWKLRWATLGYHHDWDSKKYSEQRKSHFPEELAQLSALFTSALGWKDYHAQAAIVNFYHVGSTLSAHTDHSEEDLSLPLVSISFGLSAIFLIGGESKKVKPHAILIRSGDVIVMTRQARVSYHAVARVLDSTEEKLGATSTCCDSPLDLYMENSRININIRQLRAKQS